MWRSCSRAAVAMARPRSAFAGRAMGPIRTLGSLWMPSASTFPISWLRLNAPGVRSSSISAPRRSRRRITLWLRRIRKQSARAITGEIQPRAAILLDVSHRLMTTSEGCFILCRRFTRAEHNGNWADCPTVVARFAFPKRKRREIIGQIAPP